MNVFLHNFSIEILNVSTNMQLERLHDSLYGSVLCKIIYIFLLVLTHVLGPLAVVGIIAYEKRSGDPKKRNIINRLQTFGLTNQIIFSTILGLVRVWREIFGLIDFEIMIRIECLSYIAGLNFLFLFNEMTVIQVMYIVVWKRVKEINDEFWAFFLSLTTTCISCCITTVEHISNRIYIFPLKLHTANLSEPFDEFR